MLIRSSVEYAQAKRQLSASRVEIEVYRADLSKDGLPADQVQRAVSLVEIMPSQLAAEIATYERQDDAQEPAPC